jgi:hypothetical protein
VEVNDLQYVFQKNVERVREIMKNEPKTSICHLSQQMKNEVRHMKDLFIKKRLTFEKATENHGLLEHEFL